MKQTESFQWEPWGQVTETEAKGISLQVALGCAHRHVETTQGQRNKEDQTFLGFPSKPEPLEESQLPVRQEAEATIIRMRLGN